MIYMLVISVLILVVVTLFYVWKVGLKNWMVWILTPLLIFNVGFGWYTLNDLKGWPVYTIPLEDQELLFASIEDPTIYVLVRGEEGVRLHAIPYTEEQAQKVTQAMQKIGQGHRVMIEPKDENSASTLEFYEFRLQDKYPK